MKVNKDFMLCEIAGENVVVPYGDSAAKFHGMLRLNGTGTALWKMLIAVERVVLSWCCEMSE